MNNSKIIESAPQDQPQEREIELQEQLPQLRKREGELVKIIEALRKVESSHEWSTLKTEVFNGEIDRLERLLKAESVKRPLNTDQIYFLQGRLEAAKRYSLETLNASFSLELTKIRTQLNAK